MKNLAAVTVDPIVGIPKKGITIKLFCYICKHDRDHHVKNPMSVSDGQVQFDCACMSCKLLLPLAPVEVTKAGKTLIMRSEEYGLTRISIAKWNYLVTENVLMQ